MAAILTQTSLPLFSHDQHSIFSLPMLYLRVTETKPSFPRVPDLLPLACRHSSSMFWQLSRFHAFLNAK